MTEYIHYFWVGFDSMGGFPLFRNVFMALCCVVLVIVIRRLTASLRSGNRYMVYLERKKGRTITLIVGESARNCRLMESLRADTRKYGIKVYGDIS